MKRFRCKIYTTQVDTVDVDAEDEEEADEKAEALYEAGQTSQIGWPTLEEIEVEEIS